jgi:hypothetical protein
LCEYKIGPVTLSEEGQLRAVWSIESVRALGPNNDWKKLQNKMLHNLCISYDINDNQTNEMCRECDTFGKISEFGLQNPRTW